MRLSSMSLSQCHVWFCRFLQEDAVPAQPQRDLSLLLEANQGSYICYPKQYTIRNICTKKRVNGLINNVILVVCNT